MTQIKTQQLSSTSVKTLADRPQIFTVWSNEIEGRIDPSFYRPEFKELEKVIIKGKYEVKTLNEIAEKISSGATPLSGGDAYTDKSEGIPFIRSGDIREDKSIDFDQLLYIKKEIHQKKLKSSQLKKGDVLVAIVGATIGQVSLYDYDKEANINQAIAMVRVSKDINPEYVKEYLLSIVGQNQLNKIKRPVARANINLEEVGSIKIPLPPLSIQNKIVDIMRKAYQEKKEKETKANKLLESIDDYVLSELGIKMPEIKREMVFEVMSDEIRDRIDSEYYQEFYKDFIDEVKRCKFSKKKLEDITEFIMNGRTPAKDDYVENEGIPLIKAGTASGKLVDLEKLGYVKKDFKGKQTARKGDIFILSAAHQAEYVGKNVSLLDKEPAQNTYFVGELINVRANPEVCLSEYLFSFLASSFAFVLINREKRGQTSHLYPDDLKNLIVPVPPLDVQKKIVDKLKFYRTQAQKLKDEASNNLQKAKEQVERIILRKA